MAAQPTTYDLVLLLSEKASDEQRAKVLADTQSAIAASGGSVVLDADWGRRPTAFQIRHEAEAEYHLLQFQAPAPYIEELSHTLRITDGVLRFRIVKVRPGTPPPPSSPPPVVATATPSGTSAPATGATETAVRRPEPPTPDQSPGGDEAGEASAPAAAVDTESAGDVAEPAVADAEPAVADAEPAVADAEPSGADAE